MKQEKISEMAERLQNEETAIEEKFQIVFLLKEIDTEDACKALICGMESRSVLLVHEISYVLGQMKSEAAVDKLRQTLDTHHNPIVRHECAEALGALGSQSNIDVLAKHREDPERIVSESCVLALRRIDDKTKKSCKQDSDKYTSRDPSFAAPGQHSVAELERMLLDSAATLYARYTAIFALRNKDTIEAAVALSAGLDDCNALLAHEVAFVLGQMNRRETVKKLIDKLDNLEAPPIVRHECAFALGTLASADATRCLRRHLGDPEDVVRESCIVGLDMAKK